jgi:DNA-binding transcriptional MerR regulator
MKKRSAKLLNQRKAADLMGVSAKTLSRWAQVNAGPPRLRIGKRYFYTREIVVQWLAARIMAS